MSLVRLSILILWIISLTEATKCEFCNKDFVSLGRHSWRCPAKATASVVNRPTPLDDHCIQSTDVNQVVKSTPVQSDIIQVQCVCGKLCKGRRGLAMHRRSCKMANSVTTVDNGESPPAGNQPTPMAPSTPPSSPALPTLNGVKLPSSKQGWEEANLYFRINIDMSTTITSVDSFAESLQLMVYQYFVDNVGLTSSNQNRPLTDKYKDYTTKQLKRSLAELKKNKMNGAEIIYVSKLIRLKIKRAPDWSTDLDIEEQLRKRFWKTCNSIFNATTKNIPSFNVDKCLIYFRSILLQPFAAKLFTIPHWIPSLPPPTHQYDDVSPSYQEVVRAINKTKSRSCPCPLDQISVIMLKRCPQLRSALHKLIVACWQSSKIPECWKRGLTVLIYKKGVTSDPANFRPITLQPVMYKILSSVIRNRLFKYVDSNRYIDKNIQKGFWPATDGVTEHTQILSHMMKDSKRHQRSLFVTLLDLRNAFGEVHHNLIRCALRYHHVPSRIVDIINDIYTDSFVQVSYNNQSTPLIKVERGVLQGDPSSPLLFNLCFNTLMTTVSDLRYQQSGYMWGTAGGKSHWRSWLQFADDAALIAHDSKGAQSLLDVSVAWCAWAEMTLRIDKCSSFGMTKRSGQYVQIEPGLFVNGVQIPPIKIGESFKYLGGVFDFEMGNAELKRELKVKVNSLLSVTSALKVRPQSKLRIVRKYFPTQLSFQLKIADIPVTWISQQLDSLITNCVRTWLSLPISSCVAEIMSIPLNQGGYGITSLRHQCENLRLGQRFRLKHSHNDDISHLWEVTSAKCVNLDSVVNVSESVEAASKALLKKERAKATSHVQSLKLQGAMFKSVTESLSKFAIAVWSTQMERVTTPMFLFVRKALQQQLATAANLVRWGRITSPACPLCNKVQTNKHVLSNCDSATALNRYKNRHDNVLQILSEWINAVKKPDHALFVDLPNPHFKPISDVFVSLRPDIVLVSSDTVTSLELTICHESNLLNSKIYKQNKYVSLGENLIPQFMTHKLNRYSLEVTTLGFISDIDRFCKSCLTVCFSDNIRNNIVNSVIANSYAIYCNRNKID